MSAQFDFREATKSDLDILTNWTKKLINHEAVDDDLELPLRDDLDEQLALWLEQLLNNDNVLIIIAEDADKQPTGCIIGLLQMALNDFVAISTHGHIQMVWVEPNSRRSGLAAKLVEHMESTFKNLNISYSEISYSSSNIEASKFWESVGYRKVSETSRKFL